MSKEYIAGLLKERAGYTQRGEYGRAAEVEAELARIHRGATHPSKRAQTRLRRGQTRGR